MINTPTVTFANAVTQVGMPQANLTAQLLGLGGATADATNRLSVNTPNVLLNNAGASIDLTVNKNVAANDASFSFKTGFSVRALFGTLGSDDFTLKVSPNGSSFFDALVADRSTGRVKFPVGVELTGLAVDPSSPADGWLWHNSTTGQLRARLGGVTRILADQDVPWIAPAVGDYALTTSGAGGAATGVLAGAAGRIDLFPFIPRDDIILDRLSVNVTTLIAAALGKIVLYAADATGRPAALILETGDLDFSTVGLKEVTVAQTLRRGITYPKSESPIMTEPPTVLEGVAQAFRDHGLTAAITALMGGSLAIAATVTRKAFTNEAVLERLEHELAAERDRYDKRRAEDRKADADRLQRIETDIRAMRDLMFEAFQRSRAD